MTQSDFNQLYAGIENQEAVTEYLGDSTYKDFFYNTGEIDPGGDFYLEISGNLQVTNGSFEEHFMGMTHTVHERLDETVTIEAVTVWNDETRELLDLTEDQNVKLKALLSNKITAE